MRSLNDIITMPLSDAREKRIANFGRNRYEEICDVLDLNPYEQYDHQISIWLLIRIILSIYSNIENKI